MDIVWWSSVQMTLFFAGDSHAWKNYPGEFWSERIKEPEA